MGDHVVARTKAFAGRAEFGLRATKVIKDVRTKRQRQRGQAERAAIEAAENELDDNYEELNES